MDGTDPRSARLHRERLHADANRVFALEALARRELLVGRDEAAVQAGLTEIFRAARAAQQEGGANTLFLTIGALYWRPGETARRADKDRRFRAPVILIPVTLERPSVRSGFSLRAHDDETRVNPTLLEMLKQEFGLLLPALEGGQFPADADDRLDVAAVFDLFRAKLRYIAGWELADEVSLTNLSFAKYLMWKDLSDRAAILRESKLARLLMDGREEPGHVGADREAVGGGIGGERTVGERTGGALDEDATGFACPFEADSSQLQAVAAARAGESFVLIGPPGTGKSQTIANIIADTLSQGRSVLFVAEKRAALEVVQRHLARIGLADFCLDLFSPKSSKSLVLEQMNRAQQVSENFDAASWDAANGDIAALRAELNAYVRALHKHGRNGWTPFRAMGVTLRAEAGGVPRVELSWPNADIHDPGAYQRLVELVEDAASVLVRVGDITEAAALLGVEATEWSPPWEARLLDAARMYSARLKAFAAAAAASRRALLLDGGDLSRQGLAALVSLAAALLDPAAREATWASRHGADVVAEQGRGLAFHAARHAELKGALTARWRPAAMDLRLADIKVGWAAADQRWWLPRWHARGKIRTMMKAVCEGKLPTDLAAELGRLAGMQEAGRAIGVAGAAMTATLGSLWAGLDTDFDRIATHWDWARRLRAATAAVTADADVLLALRERLRPLLGDGADMLALEANLGGTLAQLRDAGRAVETASDGLAALCGGDPMNIEDPARADWAAALAARLDLWQGAAPHLRDWCAWRGVAQRADALGVAAVLRAMQDRVVAPVDAVRVFEANYARWWVGLAVDGSATLKAFVAAQHENRIERFRALDERMLGLAARLARAVVVGAIPGKAAREQDPEYAVLARELAKRQRHLPVRQLAERMPGALRRLTPCLMMSPLSVAQYLPANAAQFDLVIFDEASQIATWDAIGVVGRGRQAIVVGDPKQLPPTRFFERQMPGHDGGADGIAVDAEDLESILDECLAAGIPAIALKWHYRSRHESLIAFSNHAYYGGGLVTFPSPVTEDRAVSFRHVADGAYARAGARTNLPEARAVVAEAVALLRAELAGGRPRSVGVVTFNAEQQALVENLLDEARRQDPALEPFFADDAAEPVLVKNLEGVQGEERDVMLFSLTYGPDQSGRVAMNFGPLNQAGGERRLNVAVTRAREALIVFGSLRPEHIDLARTQAVGVAHLKRFLDYALHGAQAFARAASSPLGDFESPFEAAVAERLSARGWVLQPQVGVSGFRIDLGVVDPDLPGAFLAGVECDGATYHRGATARDRDRLRQLVLERLGWRILRIWSTDWWTNAAREADRLHTALQAALDGARTARAPGGPIVIVDDDAPGALATADADDADNAVEGDVDLGAETAPAVTPTAAAPGATEGETTLVSSTAVAANSIPSPALDPAAGAPVATGTVVSQRVGSFMNPAGLAVIDSAGAAAIADPRNASAKTMAALRLLASKPNLSEAELLAVIDAGTLAGNKAATTKRVQAAIGGKTAAVLYRIENGKVVIADETRLSLARYFGFKV